MASQQAGIMGAATSARAAAAQPPHGWTALPPEGLFVVVTKQGKEVGRLRFRNAMIRFGRNHDVCEAPQDHLSISRVHAALYWHGADERPYIEDLGSAHGTFLFDHTRLQANRPHPMRIDQSFRLGASTRQFTVVKDVERARLDAKQERATKRRFLAHEQLDRDNTGKRTHKKPKVQFFDDAPQKLPEPAKEGEQGRFANIISSTLVKKAENAETRLQQPSAKKKAAPRAQRGAGARLARLHVKRIEALTPSTPVAADGVPDKPDKNEAAAPSESNVLLKFLASIGSRKKADDTVEKDPHSPKHEGFAVGAEMGQDGQREGRRKSLPETPTTVSSLVSPVVNTAMVGFAAAIDDAATNLYSDHSGSSELQGTPARPPRVAAKEEEDMFQLDHLL